MSVPTSCFPPATCPVGDLRLAHRSSGQTTGTSVAPVCCGGRRAAEGGASFSRPLALWCALQHVCTDCRLVLFSSVCSLLSLCFSRISSKHSSALLVLICLPFPDLFVSGGKRTSSSASLGSGTGRVCATTPLFPVLLGVILAALWQVNIPPCKEEQLPA